MAQHCGSNAKYFSLIDECVPLSIASSDVFLNAFTSSGNTCSPPGPIVTVADLEALRYCGYVNGSLTIAVKDSSADFSALRDIEIISGLFRRAVVCIAN